jgi:hypothetical protein
VVEPMHCSTNPTFLVESDESTKLVDTMQCSVDPTLISRSDMSTGHVLFTSSSKPSEQGGIPLCSLQVLGWFLLIGIILLSLSFLLLHPSK